jgi:2-polyprenyl-3-methyl-5-hydroxy-6-metoxy-1,4-benzoquinol methylase
MAPHDTCVLCGGPMSPLAIKVAGEWGLSKCGSCGLQSMWPQPDDKVLASIYGKDYFKSWGVTQGEEPAFLRKMKRTTFRRQLRLLATQIPQGHVLDVGCATGLFMESAKEAGYAVSGLDISAFAVEVARRKFGEAAIFHGALEQLAETGKQFDVITMSDYIEHVRDPLAAFESAAKLLRPGGCLLIQTPNAASTSARLMGRRWTHYKLEHLWYFTPAAASALADKAGLRTLRIQAARKALNLSYVRQQFSVYHHPLLTPLTRILHAITLRPLRSMSVVLPAGELIALFQKPR